MAVYIWKKPYEGKKIEILADEMIQELKKELWTAKKQGKQARIKQLTKSIEEIERNATDKAKGESNR